MGKTPRRRDAAPRKPATERKRKSLTFRIRDQLRAKLDKAAEANERTVSEETEHRLMMSFYQDDLGKGPNWENLEKKIDRLRTEVTRLVKHNVRAAEGAALGVGGIINRLLAVERKLGAEPTQK